MSTCSGVFGVIDRIWSLNTKKNKQDISHDADPSGPVINKYVFTCVTDSTDCKGEGYNVFLHLCSGTTT